MPRIFLLLLLAIFTLCGCQPDSSQQSETAKETPRPVPLRILIIDDAELAETIDREWQARADGMAFVRQMSKEELLTSSQGRLGADIIIYPSGLMGELAMRDWIVPFVPADRNDATLAQRDFLPLARLREVTWGEKTYAVPFGSPVFCLMIRRDFVEKHGVSPPETWREYQQSLNAWSEQLSDNQGKFTHIVAEPLAKGWAGQILLARAAAYARHRSQFSTLFDSRTMEPLIAGPPFVRALQELVLAAREAPDQVTSMTPADVCRAVLAGEVVMGICWPTLQDVAGTEQGADGGEASDGAVGFAELPGATDVYNFRTESWENRSEDEETRVTLLAVSGRLGSLTRECRDPYAGLDMLLWMTSAELGTDIAADSEHTTIFRSSQLANASRWMDASFDPEARSSYAATLKAAFSRSAWLSSLRIPGRDQYLAALDEAVHQAIGGKSAVDALQTAAERWRQITNEQGLDSQRAAYQQSIGLEP